MDIAYPFLFNLATCPQYTAFYPALSDRVDLHTLKRQCQAGVYVGGLSRLFDDIDKMIRNGKSFNEPNRDFQVWRLIDMFEKAIERLKIIVLSDGSLQTGIAFDKYAVPTNSSINRKLMEEMAEEAEEV